MFVYLFVLVIINFHTSTEGHGAKFCLNICPPCLPHEIQSCPSISNCSTVVEESGCGRCCKVCALKEGGRCGVSLAPCGPGLQCRGTTETSTLSAILLNRGTCQVSLVDGGSTAISSDVTTRHIRSTRWRSSRRRTSRHPHRGLLVGLNYDGPCSRHLETVMTSCGTLPLVAWIPVCERGFYKAKQCVTSGRDGRLGKCWCVTRRGDAVGNRSDTIENLSCPPIPTH